MENSTSPFVLDISSDEEAGLGDARKDVCWGIGGGVLSEDDCDWLSKLLGEVDGTREDDSDDEMLVREVSPKPSRKSGLESLKPSAKVDDESNDDDDCVILDGDPDKPVVVSGRADDSSECNHDSDDLEIVSEKGEVACRDFAHARHLCAKFLFASTPHEVHCGQCHCYVCDLLAPCSYWGTGFSTADHCHASDKEEHWKAERTRMKKGDKPAIFQTTQSPALAAPQPRSLPRNQGLCPVTMYPCPVSSNVSVPTVVNHGRVHPYGRVVPRYKSQSDLVSLQSHPTVNNIVGSRNKNRNIASRSAQSIPALAVFRRPGIIRSSPINRHAFGSPLSRDSFLRRHPPLQTPMTNEHHGSNPQNIGRHDDPSIVPRPKFSPLPGMAVGRPNYLSSQTQIHSLPYSNCLIRGPTLSQSQTLSQPYVNGDFGSAVPLQPQLPSQPSMENFENLIASQSHFAFHPDSPLPSQTLASNQSDAGNTFGNHLHLQSMVSSHSGVGHDIENQSSQRQARDSPASLLMDGQNGFFHKGNHTYDGLDMSATYHSITSDSSFNHGNQLIHTEVSESQVTAPADNSRLQNMTEENDYQSIAPSKNFRPRSVVPVDNSSLLNGTDFHFPESTKSDVNFQFGNWMFEDHSLPGAWEDPVSPGRNEFSPGPASIGIDAASTIQN